MYYYYKIENKINYNKYIGITTNPIVRKNRHFNYLRKNKHFNPHLQAAYNKYGEENFEFKILENRDFEDEKEAYKYEATLIEKYDTYNNGYNCNPGGLWTGPRGIFTKEQVFYIKSANYFCKGCGIVLSKIFNCPSSTIYNITNNRNYKKWCNEFDLMNEVDKERIYQEFCFYYDFIELMKFKSIKENSRILTKEQVFIILLNEERHFTTWTNLRKLFNNSNRGENYYRIRNRKTYLDYCDKFDKLSDKEKDGIWYLYTEMCIE